MEDSVNNKILLWWDKFWETSIIVLLFGIVFLGFVQVIFRYILNSPLTWSEAICRYMYVWMVFVGSAVVINTEGHLTLTFFVDKMPRRIRQSLKVVANLVVIFVLILIFIKEGAYLTKVTSSQISATVGNKMSWVYVAIPLGGVLMVLNTLRQLVRQLRGGEE